MNAVPMNAVPMNAVSMNVHLRGHAIWTPGFDSLEALKRGQSDPSLTRPEIAIVDSRMKRATSLMTRMAVECVVRATEAAGLALDETATLFGSEHGEIQIAVDQMAMMHDGDGRISPARFKNSVHNTAAGLYSIAAVNRGFTTAIAAGHDTFALTLLEAMAILKSGEARHAVVSVSDEPLPAPIDRFATHGAFAIAIALSVEGEGPIVEMPRLEDSDETSDVPPALDHHSAAGAYRLLDAALAGRAGDVALSPRWKVTLR